jgi:PAS domain S-box-containing protein
VADLEAQTKGPAGPDLNDFIALAENMPALAWMADSAGWIFWYNPQWYKYTGTSPEDMKGWGWQAVHDPVALPGVMARWKASLASGEPFDMVFPLRGADGRFRPFLTRVTPVRSPDGSILRWFGTNTDISEQQAAVDELADQKKLLETLNRTSQIVASELALDKLVQATTDAGVALTGAQFGAFFYNVVNDRGEEYTLYAISGVPRAAFEKFPMPRNTAVFDPTFKGTGPMRSDDITQDPRYGKNAPHRGMPEGHLPVRSYLAVPVKSRNGEVLGGLFFGHSERERFTQRHEQMVVGIASQAAIGIDNARLYESMQRELAERRAAERQRELLINELNHRVKNTLATVQSAVTQTLRNAAIDPDIRRKLDARLIALSEAHDLLTRENWEGTTLKDVAHIATSPYSDGSDERFKVQGPHVRLPPKTALTLAMAMHELVTNAIKYGSLSKQGGQVQIDWQIMDTDGGRRLKLAWSETGGPLVEPPRQRGFGSRLIERGLSAELDGAVALDFHPTGVVCTIDSPLPRIAMQDQQREP